MSGAAPGADVGRGPRRRPLALALAAVALSFLPFLGLALAAVALVVAARERRRAGAALGAVPVAVLGTVLSAGFTAGYVACAPSRETPSERRTWEEFDRRFAPGSIQPSGNTEEAGGSGPAGP